MSLRAASRGGTPVLALALVVITATTASAQQSREFPVAFGPALDGAFTGSAAAAGMSFASRPVAPGVYELTVDLPDARRVEAWVDYESGFASIRLISVVSEAVVPVAAEDLDAIRSLGSMIIRSGGDSDQSDSAYLFFNVLSWLTDAPPGMLLDLRTQLSPKDIIGRCSKVGKNVQATWDAGTIFTEIKAKKVKVGPCLAGDCLGRCGAGCDGAFGWEKAIQQFTQDCLNHDVCCDEETGGCGSLFCQDEFQATFDDALIARDCNALEGVWKISFKTNRWTASVNYILEMESRGDFTGTAPLGSYTTTIQGTRGAPSMQGASIAVPTVVSPCDDLFGGYGRANLKGASVCGKFNVRLKAGRWPLADYEACELLGSVSWTGRLVGKRIDRVPRDGVERVLEIATATPVRRE